jgi:predicted nucleic acid-binding protein
VSELARPRPESRVLDWLSSIPADRAFVSVLTLAEIDQGIEALSPEDERRGRYQQFRSHMEAQFAGRLLPLDDETVRLWGVLSGQYRRTFGGKAPVVDTLLAATAQRRRLHVATRIVSDIRRLGVSAFDPRRDDPGQYPLQL